VPFRVISWFMFLAFMRCVLVNFGLALIQGRRLMAQAGGNGFMFWILLGIIIGGTLGVLISIALRKSKSKPEKLQAASPQTNTPPAFPQTARRVGVSARRCPVCNSTYTDESLSYCVSDGSPLLPVTDNSATRDPGATVLYPEKGDKDLPPTVASPPN
jgi:hypothetical protein